MKMGREQKAIVSEWFLKKLAEKLKEQQHLCVGCAGMSNSQYRLIDLRYRALLKSGP